MGRCTTSAQQEVNNKVKKYLMRIIAGKHRGRKLVDCSKLKDLRPTTDRNREALFNILNSSRVLREIGFELNGTNVLDVFCGSGAISFEALSRGAKLAGLIDKNAKHLEIAKENAKILKETNIEFFQSDLERPIFAAKKSYNLIFLDPPYAQNLINNSLNNLTKAGWIEDKALIVLESNQDEEIKLDEKNFKFLDKRDYDKTVFTFLQFNKD